MKAYYKLTALQASTIERGLRKAARDEQNTPRERMEYGQLSVAFAEAKAKPRAESYDLTHKVLSGNR